MATISCKCDTCKRSTEIVENTHGLTIIGRCTITAGCRGKLIQIDRNPNTARGADVAVQPGVDNYVPRKAFAQHIQSLSSARWKVEHDLGVLPATFVYLTDADGKYVQLDNDQFRVEPLNEDVIYINFDIPQKGIVQCVARSSVPVEPDTYSLPDNSKQVSTKGVITFAVPRYLTNQTPAPSGYFEWPLDLCATASVIKVEIEITRPNQDPIVCFEDLENVIDVRSPWTGWNAILLEGRRESCIRSSAILKIKAFGSANLVEDDIPNGTRIRFLRIDYGTGIPQDIPSRGLMMLLAKVPYDYIDKDLENIVDVGEVIGYEEDYFTYKDGELYLPQSYIEKTYPLVQRQTVVIIPPVPSMTPSMP